MAQRRRKQNICSVFRTLTISLVFLGIAGAAAAQSAATWSGQAQCQLNMQLDGYSHQEIQTWTTTGQPPQPGGMAVYPATWSVSGQGGLQKVQGAQAIAARWNSSVPQMNAPLAIFIRASDNRLIIKAWHSQLRADGGTS